MPKMKNTILFYSFMHVYVKNKLISKRYLSKMCKHVCLQ